MADPATHPATANPAPLCPECGSGMDAPPPRVRSRLVAACRWLPWIGLLLVGAVLVGGAITKQSRPGFGMQLYWRSVAGLKMPQLAAVASGELDGRAMAAEFERDMPFPWMLGTETVLVGLTSPSGTREELTQWGWPVPCLMRQRTAQFEDALEQTTPVARDWGVIKHSFWTGSTRYSYGTPGPATPSYELFDSSLPHLALVCVLIVGGWCAGPFVWALVARARRRPKPRRRVAQLVGAGCVLAVYLCTLLFPSTIVSYSLEPTHASNSYTAPTPPSAFETGWTVEDFRTALRGRDGPQVIARHLASVLPHTAVDASALVLGIEPVPGRIVHATYAGWPNEWLYWESETPSQNMPPHRRAGLHFDGTITALSYSFASNGMVTVSTEWLAVYALAGFAAWHLLLAVSRFVDWRLIRRRKERRLCMCCGYDLAGLRAVPQSV